MPSIQNVGVKAPTTRGAPARTVRIACANSEVLTHGAARSCSGRWSSKDFNGTGARPQARYSAGAVRGTELRADVADMPFRGAQRHRQPVCDHCVGRTLGHEPEDVELASGERLEELTVLVPPHEACDPWGGGPVRTTACGEGGDDVVDERGRRLPYERQEGQAGSLTPTQAGLGAIVAHSV
jgi:hypothetical protein